MTSKEMQAWVAMVHNKIADISVRGDDAIRVAEVLTECRRMVAQLGQNTQPAEEQQTDE